MINHNCKTKLGRENRKNKRKKFSNIVQEKFLELNDLSFHTENVHRDAL